ncbi:hypothetical protein EV368DRAFT_67787 [Lentinula lateritia]|nr:hypothetical protein EV368DRAFT_67787 [Lentinula lateritia]
MPSEYQTYLVKFAGRKISKIFNVSIILASCLGVFASPVDIAKYSPRSGPSTTPLVAPTSDFSGLERRVDKLQPISTGFVIIPQSNKWFAELVSVPTSEVLYVLVLQGRNCFIKEGDDVSYKALRRAVIHQVTNLGIDLHIKIPQDPKELADILQKVSPGTHGCAWLIEVVNFLTRVAQTRGSEVGISKVEAENAINLIMSKENSLGIPSSCSGH